MHSGRHLTLRLPGPQQSVRSGLVRSSHVQQRPEHALVSKPRVEANGAASHAARVAHRRQWPPGGVNGGAEGLVGYRLPGNAKHAAGGPRCWCQALRAAECHLRAEAAAGVPEGQAQVGGGPAGGRCAACTCARTPLAVPAPPCCHRHASDSDNPSLWRTQETEGITYSIVRPTAFFKSIAGQVRPTHTEMSAARKLAARFDAFHLTIATVHQRFWKNCVSPSVPGPRRPAAAVEREGGWGPRARAGRRCRWRR